MQLQNFSVHKLTSVSIRKESFRTLKVAQASLLGQGKFMSEQEIFRGLIQLYLQKWKGAGSRTAGLRRYNLKGLGYLVKPLYLDMELLAAAWARAIHSGISISRMLDFAIRNYLGFFLQMHKVRMRSNEGIEATIKYECETLKNSGHALHFIQLIEFYQPRPMPP